jgi:hypothetical protein
MNKELLKQKGCTKANKTITLYSIWIHMLLNVLHILWKQTKIVLSTSPPREGLTFCLENCIIMLKFIKGRDFLCVWLRFMITMTLPSG